MQERKHTKKGSVKTEVLCAAETNIYIYTTIHALWGNTVLNLTQMNSNADVCMFLRERDGVGGSMNLLSLVAPLEVLLSSLSSSAVS